MHEELISGLREWAGIPMSEGERLMLRAADALETMQAAIKDEVAAERERCAKLCDEKARRNFPWGSENSDIYHAQANWAAMCAAAIRGTTCTKT